MTVSILDARRYVGTTPLSGLAQYALLRQVGFKPAAGVIEIGCGALHLAKPLLAERAIVYVGVDPSVWLRDAARAHDPVLDRLVETSGARFSDREDFRGWSRSHDAGILFAHSVLTHASREQLPAFFAAARDAKRALVSINLADRTTAGDDWSYPDGIAFSLEDVRDAADETGWHLDVRDDLRDFYMSYRPAESHHWLYLTKP